MTERIPVTLEANDLLAYFKKHIRMTSDDLDADLRENMMAAVEDSENHIGKVILQSEFVLTLPSVRAVRLKAPLVSVEGLEVDGTEVTDYTLDGTVLTPGPSVSGSSMTVRYVAGISKIPHNLKKAVCLQAATYFNNPVDSVRMLTTASERILRHYRWRNFDGEQD